MPESLQIDPLLFNALLEGVRSRDVAAVEALLKAGVGRSLDCCNALDLAIGNNDLPMVKILVGAGAKRSTHYPSALWMAAEYTEVIRFFLEKGMIAPEESLSILEFALSEDRLSLVQLLVKHGGSVQSGLSTIRSLEEERSYIPTQSKAWLEGVQKSREESGLLREMPVSSLAHCRRRI